jgi:NADH-quinone oxidoreductase subunit E
MAWKAIDRVTPVIGPKAAPVLNDAVREKIRSFFPRYETRRAVLLPALHIVQDALGHITWPAMAEIAELLEIAPSDVLDTVSFYSHFWTHPKGSKVVTVCRSISCELMGGGKVLDAVKRELGIEEHHTTKDGKYSLVTEECLAGCDHAPCLIINERMHKRVRPEDVPKILADERNAEIAFPRSELFDAPKSGDAERASDHERDDSGNELETTSDVREMQESE